MPLLGWEVYSYGALLGASLLCGWFLTHRHGREEGFPRETVADAFVVAALGGLVGARLLYVLVNLSDFENPVKVFQVAEGGLAAWGGLLGGALATAVFLRRRRLSCRAWFDAIMPSVVLGSALTRIGSFLHGSDFGRTSDSLSWAVQFPAGTPAYEWHDQIYGLAAQGVASSRPVHPVQLYGAVAAVAILLLVLVIRRRRRFSGELFLAATVLHGVSTYVLENFRGDPKRGWLWIGSVSQVLSLLVIGAAVVGYGALYRRWRRDPDHAFDLGPGIHAAIEADRESRR